MIDPIWNKGTPMPKHYTCHCGLYVHHSRRNPEAIHIDDCPYHSDNYPITSYYNDKVSFGQPPPMPR